jgi:DNA-binding LytR/AlgR family response regulator
MKIVIIEDEKIIAEELAHVIESLRPDYVIAKVLETVEQAKEYFSKSNTIDLIFADIQLGDGASFDVFKSAPVGAPIIFCTAHDEYMLEAFKANGIGYVLKPFDTKDIANALDKFEKIAQTGKVPINQLLQYLGKHEAPPVAKSILLHQKDKIIPIDISDIAVIHLDNGSAKLYTFDNQIHFTTQALEEFDALKSTYFFRANRQTILNRKAVKEAAQYLNRKLLVTLHVKFSSQILVSKEKTSAFLNWLKSS